MWCSSNFMTGGRTKSIAWPSSLRTKSYGISTVHFWIRPFSLSRVKDLKLHEWKILTTYRSDVLDICRHSVQSSRLKLFAVRWSEVYFSRFAFLTIKNHVQLSPRVVYLPKTERDCWTSTTKDSTLKKFPSNNAFGQLKIWQPRRYRPISDAASSKKVLLKSIFGSFHCHFLCDITVILICTPE